MFRKMQRIKQQLSDAECISILKSEPRGILSVTGDNGYPYGMPMDHWYNEEDGHLYFHSGKTGHRTDSILKDDRCSFCVCDQGFRREGEWALNIRSVIVFGHIRIVEDHERAIDICRRLSFKYTSDSEYIESEIAKYASGMMCFELIPEHMTGKLVNEA